MRAIPTSFIACVTANQLRDASKRRFVVVQSADPVDLKAQVLAAKAALLAEQGHTWLIAFIDLAGAGDGHSFVFLMEIVDATGFSDADGQSLLAADLTTWMASEQEALARTDATALAASVVGQQAEIFQSVVAGSSKGTRFMGLDLIQRT